MSGTTPRQTLAAYALLGPDAEGARLHLPDFAAELSGPGALVPTAGAHEVEVDGARVAWTSPPLTLTLTDAAGALTLEGPPALLALFALRAHHEALAPALPDVDATAALKVSLRALLRRPPAFLATHLRATPEEVATVIAGLGPEAGAFATSDLVPAGDRPMDLWLGTPGDPAFAGGWQAVLPHLTPAGRAGAWVGWRIRDEGAPLGMRYEGLVQVGARWVWIPKPWRARPA